MTEEQPKRRGRPPKSGGAEDRTRRKSPTRSPVEGLDDGACRERLEVLSAYFEEGGPLAHLLLGERMLDVVPELPPSSNEGEALVTMWTAAAPRLTDLAYRRQWRDYLERLHEELGAEAPTYHPDRIALVDAKHWIGDRRATGAPSFENALLQLLFDLSCERGFLEGWLPSWLAAEYAYSLAAIEQVAKRRREHRAMLRVTYGPLQIALPRRLTPSVGEVVLQLAGDDLDPDALADAAVVAADRDLTIERRSEVALLFREASGAMVDQHLPFTAFDLRAIFEVLAEGGDASDRLAHLLYSRAIDAHLATSQKRRQW